ncbi:sensor histidine kinase [Embleya scabrispora]|uniref:sensor histidine kinase n=1 Tax=Embleya scabrispora TaxID=159449 RepID=UPI00037A40BE|nr:histidine kinase [Embleya scabrispora]MYS81978.1 histidine kinase [Streptomyces sp. SID5474]
MTTAPPGQRRRIGWTVAAVSLVLLPLPLAAPVGVLAALPAALAVGGALPRWPIGRVSLTGAAWAAVATSLLIDICYPGPHQLAGFWMPFEFVGLWLTVERVVRRLPGRAAVWLGSALGLAIAALPLRFTLRAPAVTWEASVAMCAVALLPAAATAGVGLYLRSLDDRRTRAVALARRLQRLEVARDLHDFVAHEVTGIVLEAQAGQLDEPTGADAEHTRALLARIEQAGLRALESMDRTVRTLRESAGEDDAAELPEPPTRVYGMADLPVLVERFAGSGRVRAELDLAPDLAGALPGPLDEAAYFVVLEALTNVRRHAPDTAGVTVAVGPARTRGIEVSVTDLGGASRPAPAERDGGGTGLAALGARLEALGGSLTAGPHQGGWRVVGLLPTTRQHRPARTPGHPTRRPAPEEPHDPAGPSRRLTRAPRYPG